ncbi:hypothetical protein A165_12655 [Vibrio tasmaniensis ZS-17]|uniref:hypothetical protein n=1 Tax=Vibrio tasmaniensis TaxID=212663 RepID=UPI0002FB8DEF|nr:hypothetical protein [Vibrio tasmaniensis]OED64034.1 hypothetical protein A165_12655 [Vibrio tasmaniensis ZS-17]
MKTITNTQLDSKPSTGLAISSHEKKSSEKLTLDHARGLVGEISNINLFLSSGSIQDEDIISPLFDEVQTRLEELESVIVFLKRQQH